MSKHQKSTDYSQWQSSIDLEKVFAKASTPSYLQAHNNRLYWVESLTEEQGRTVICYVDDAAGITSNSETVASKKVIRLTPEGFNVRTKANEYGGRSYLVGKSAVYFCNYSDQRIYRQSLSNPEDISVLTTTKDTYFADLSLSESENHLFFVMEQSFKSSSELAKKENKSSIGCISLTDREPKIQTIVESADFYSSLAVYELDKTAYRLAWVEWDHPNMPWDKTDCMTASFTAQNDNLVIASEALSVLTQTEYIDNSHQEFTNSTATHCQFTAKGDLLLTIDSDNKKENDLDNYANIYRFNIDQLSDELASGPKILTHSHYEYSYPHWIFGNQRFCSLNDKDLIAIGTNAACDELHLISNETGVFERIAAYFNTFNHLCVDPDNLGNAFVVASNSLDDTALLHYSSKSQKLNRIKLDYGVADSDSKPYPIAETSLPQIMEVGGVEERSYAYYYAPKNSQYNSDGLPPLLVMVHGGPTARAYPSFDIQKQFWTSSGFAVLDINHRGSSGFGRQYRDALLGEWGEVDAQDINNAVQQCIEQSLADPNKLFIRGKSAGGYAVQRALTVFPNLFSAGASYYGIGDLVTLAEITHKFESHYTDRLIGEEFTSETANSPESLYFHRSPINYVDKLKSPMIVFQGGEDKVVPPALALQIVDALQNKGVVCDYHEYPKEGHGFRSKEVLVDSLSKELAFYRRFMT